uniref:Contains similarity to receptor protein kinase n=2 Tax=Oryza sativa subsp. japonica TaxID=39947 RepID=Q7G5E5_ORYSJ|nr:Contains similarity to receptor protein kinase [Oryza sativa Japonica Group]AAM47614.1 Putative receptor-like protein kinase [Oryza sativa Japonica Group]AAP51981.1 Protein kinase domain containing protein [Oryza sativa Japonica Group]
MTRSNDDLDLKEIGGPRQFIYRDLNVATNKFLNVIGRGAFGVVCRGSLGGYEVAVKTLINGRKDFIAELSSIGGVKHKNLVRLIGWCRQNRFNIVDFIFWWRHDKKNKLFLVYELDIANALLYLHEECHPYILHRDIKPDNILLDNNFNAKLADFGLSRIADPDNNIVKTTAHGTKGYIDPLCMRDATIEFDRSSDMYSFGMVLLVVACTQGTSREQVWQLYQDKSLLQAADDNLRGQYDETQMERVLILGLCCSRLDDATKRPTIRQALAFLEHGGPMPGLESLINPRSNL